MKKALLFAVFFLSTFLVYSQVPEFFNYQAVVRTAAGQPVVSQTVSILFTIYRTTPAGTNVYSEKQSPTTNEFGLVTLAIGNGSDKSGDFTTIDWSTDNYFLNVKIDPSGGSTYTDMGTTQLLSVPYAMHAKSVASYTETDPVFGTWDKSTGISITTSHISDFQTSVTNNDAVLLNTAKNSYPAADQTKLAGIAYGANVGVVPNSPITGETKTKITYDSKGLVTSGTDATTADIAPYTDRNYVTDAQLIVIGNSSGINTGDETEATIKTKLSITTLSGSNTGDQDGSETKVTAGTNITVTGGGTTASPYVVNAIISMTQTQRDALAVTEGMIVYNNTTHKPNYYNGTEWMNYDGTSAKTLAIGDSHQGGIIAYILQPGDPGYDANITHGIIAAPSDQSTGIQWFNGTFETTGATGTALGTGNANTSAIVSAQGDGDYAAKLCYDLILNGYSDWYLPSGDELGKLCINKVLIGGFDAFNFYWSSTEFIYNQAFAETFGNCGLYNHPKDEMCLVRAIRAF